MSGHKSKAFTLSFDEEKGRTLDRFMEERKQTAEAGTIGIPFGSLDFTEVTTSSSFFLHPLIPQFLLEYGPKVHRILNSFECNDGEVDMIPPEELAFYQALPNLTTLSTHSPGENVPQVEMPALRNLKLLSLQSVQDEEENDEDDDSDASPPLVINVDFLLNCPNLQLLWLPDEMDLEQYVKILTDLGAYFAHRNGSSWPTLTIFIEDPSFGCCDSELIEELNQTEGVGRLIKELAASDGRILIECMPITLLDEAVRLFSNQPGKLRRFGKCVRSLRGFSSSLYEVELPNMRKMKVEWGLLFKVKEREDSDVYTRTTSWPKLEEIEMDFTICPEKDLSYLKKLLFGSGVRPSVKRLDFGMTLQVLSSDAALLEKLPNLTQLTLHVVPENVESFRNLMRTLPMSCPKLGCLQINALYPLEDVDFLGGNDGELPPLLQLPGKLFYYDEWSTCQTSYAHHQFIIFLLLCIIRTVSDLKWLLIGSRENDGDDSQFVTDAVFVKVFSLMRLEFVFFSVPNLRVGVDKFIHFSNWKVNSPLYKYFS
jgi:hypothetical protein